jgi:hypothetical protein
MKQKVRRTMFDEDFLSKKLYVILRRGAPKNLCTQDRRPFATLRVTNLKYGGAR